MKKINFLTSLLFSVIIIVALCFALPLSAQSPSNDDDQGVKCFPPSQRESCHFLACVNFTCEPCTESAECWEDSMICRQVVVDPETGATEGHCVLEPMFYKGFDLNLVVAMMATLVVCIIGVVGGLGGGGVLVPIFAGIAQFPMHDAIFLSLATLVGQAIINIPAIMFVYDPEYSPNVKNALTMERLIAREEERKMHLREQLEQQQNQIAAGLVEDIINNDENNKNNNVEVLHDEDHDAVIISTKAAGDVLPSSAQFKPSQRQLEENLIDAIHADHAAVKVKKYLSSISDSNNNNNNSQKEHNTPLLGSAYGNNNDNGNGGDDHTESNLLGGETKVTHDHHHEVTFADETSNPRSSFSSPRLIPTRPLAAFDLLVLWFPSCAAGTFIGELISRLLPSWIRMSALFILTCFITYRTAKRSIAHRKLENAHKQQQKQKKANGNRRKVGINKKNKRNQNNDSLAALVANEAGVTTDGYGSVNDADHKNEENKNKNKVKRNANHVSDGDNDDDDDDNTNSDEGEYDDCDDDDVIADGDDTYVENLDIYSGCSMYASSKDLRSTAAITRQSLLLLHDHYTDLNFNNNNTTRNSARSIFFRRAAASQNKMVLNSRQSTSNANRSNQNLTSNNTKSKTTLTGTGKNETVTTTTGSAECENNNNNLTPRSNVFPKNNSFRRKSPLSEADDVDDHEQEFTASQQNLHRQQRSAVSKNSRVQINNSNAIMRDVSSSSNPNLLHPKNENTQGQGATMSGSNFLGGNTNQNHNNNSTSVTNSFMTRQSTSRASTQSKQENNVNLGDEAGRDSMARYYSEDTPAKNRRSSNSRYGADEDGDGTELNFQPHPDSLPRVPVLELTLLAVTVIVGVCVAHFVIHGTNIACGSGLFWGLLAAGIAVDVVISFAYRVKLSRIANRVSVGITHTVQLPCEWNFKNSVVLPLLSCSAGMASSLFGLGGGTIVGPLLLEAGVAPERVSASGSVLTGFLGLQSMLVAMGGDSVTPSWDYIATFAVVGALSTIFGRFFALREIKRRKATWLIIMFLALILILTLLSTVSYGAYNLAELMHYGDGVGLGKICPVTENQKKSKKNSVVTTTQPPATNHSNSSALFV